MIKTNERIYPVGRLDYNTTGVLILTNDGEFAQLLTHPKNKVKREYEVKLHNGDIVKVDSPSRLPAITLIEEMREPIVLASILVPQEHLGSIITLCVQRRGVQKDMQFIGKQVSLQYELPMNEVVLDFFDRLKSVSRGYASLVIISSVSINPVSCV